MHSTGPSAAKADAAGIAVSRDTGLSMPSCGMPATIAIGLSIIAMPPDGHGMHHHTGSALPAGAPTDGQARSADNRITQWPARHAGNRTWNPAEHARGLTW
jgi:hypothetical protein